MNSEKQKHPLCKMGFTTKKSSSRNTEKRRERSKVAARCRRGKESEIFSDLASALPLSDHIQRTLDKASIARLSVANLKLNGMMSSVFKKGSTEDTNVQDEKKFDQLLSHALGGFAFVLSTDGDLTYISESVTKCLGLSQCEVMGQSIFEFTHPCDHFDIKELVALNKYEAKDVPIPRSGFFRMKCTITSKGRSVHIRAASYKGISCSGRLYTDDNDSKVRWFVGVGEPLLDPTDVNLPLNKQAFVTRHSMDMKCEDVSGNIEEFLGYSPNELVGRSWYEFQHASDGILLGKSVKALYAKGQIQTERYRFLAKNGGWAWCVTQATVLKSETGLKSNGIVCLHFITSGIENAHDIVSEIQCKVTAEFNAEEPLEKTVNTDEIRLTEILNTTGLSSPTPSTAKIFAPRTDDMDSGFLCGSLLIVTKEEPEDLTHLAPIAGDGCVPVHVPLLEDLLRSFGQANLEYSMNGYYVDADADQLPLFDMDEGSSRDALLSETCVQFPGKGMGSDSSVPYSSPLLLNSDPLMAPALDSSFCPLSSQSLVENEKSNDGGIGLIMDGVMKENSAIQTLNELDVELEGGMKGIPVLNQNSSHSEELSEFRAPFIPVDSGEDISMIYESGYAWPSPRSEVETLDDEPSAENSCSGNSGGAKMQPSTPDTSLSKSDGNKIKQKNINQINSSLDIESIFTAREPGDVPRVTTSTVLGNYESPPLKIRKIEVPRSSTLPSVHSSVTGSEVFLKCPFLNRYRELNRMREVPAHDASNLKQSSGCLDIASDAILKNHSIRKRNSNGSLVCEGDGGWASTLHELTENDYEVMVPLLETALLQGPDLLKALDSILENGFVLTEG